MSPAQDIASNDSLESGEDTSTDALGMVLVLLLDVMMWILYVKVGHVCNAVGSVDVVRVRYDVIYDVLC